MQTLTNDEIKDFEKATREASIVPTIQAAKDAYNYATTALRDLIRKLNEGAGDLRFMIEALDKGANTVRDMIGGSLTFATDSFEPDDDDIVDDAKFVTLCSITANHSNHLVGMKRAAKVCDRISNMIATKRETAAKFIMTDGRTENEIKVMKLKAYQIEKTINILTARGETMTNIFYAHKRNAEKFITQATKNFTPIFKK